MPNLMMIAQNMLEESQKKKADPGKNNFVSETYGSKVAGQNVKFSQIAPNLTMHSLGSSTIHPPSVKKIF